MSIVAGSLYADDGGILAGLLIGADDVSPAQFTAGPAVSLISQSGFRVAFTVNEVATVYGIAVAQGSAVPTPEQIIAGVDYGAVTALDARQVSVAAGVSNHLTFADIVGQAGNNVRAYLTAVDTAGNIQAQGDILTALAQLLPEVTPDTTAPVLTLLGQNPFPLVVGTPYSEPGYTSIDAVDGDITDDVVVTGSVDHTTPNQYSLTYTSTDAAGNVATRVRVVNVVTAVAGGYMQIADAGITPDDKLYPGNDFVFSGTLTNDNGDPITSGTVTLTIKTTAGVEASGMTWPAALSHVADGLWSITVDASVELRSRRRYVIELSARSGELDGLWRKTYTTESRGFQ